jgi:hypothetical protein
MCVLVLQCTGTSKSQERVNDMLRLKYSTHRTPCVVGIHQVKYDPTTFQTFTKSALSMCMRFRIESLRASVHGATAQEHTLVPKDQ